MLGTAMTLVEFLRARLNDEDEQRAEVAAKRRIIADHVREGDVCVGCWYTADDYGWPCPTLRALALLYADHRDYQQEWQPAHG